MTLRRANFNSKRGEKIYCAKEPLNEFQLDMKNTKLKHVRFSKRRKLNFPDFQELPNETTYSRASISSVDIAAMSIGVARCARRVLVQIQRNSVMLSLATFFSGHNRGTNVLFIGTSVQTNSLCSHLWI